MLRNNVYHRKDKRKKTLKFRSKQIINLNNKGNIYKKICVLHMIIYMSVNIHTYKRGISEKGRKDRSEII